MKISVSSYSFGDYMSPERLGYLGIMDKAKSMGFDGIEFVDTEYININDETAYKIREHSEKINLPVVAMSLGADFTKPAPGSFGEEITKICRYIDFTYKIGANKLRHDAAYGNFNRKYKIGFDDVLPVIVKGCTEVTEYARAYGIVTMVENHGYFVQDANRFEKLINAVANPNFGALVDIGNFMCVDEKPNYSVGVMAPYAVHVHAKDFHRKSGNEENPGAGWFATRGGNYLRGAIIGHGDANVRKSLEILRSHGYDDYITVEFEGLEDNILGIEMGLHNLKKYLSEL